MSESTEGVWRVHGQFSIGDCRGARREAARTPHARFAVFVNCAPGEISYTPADPSVRVVVVPSLDDLRSPAALEALSRSVADAVRASGGGDVLVHCMQGRVRSATTLRLLLGVLCGLSDAAAAQCVSKAKHGQVGFLSIVRRLAQSVPGVRARLMEEGVLPLQQQQQQQAAAASAVPAQ